MIYIFLDTNFVLIPVQFKVDIYSELERILAQPFKLVIVSAIFNEIELKINRERERLGKLDKNLPDKKAISKFQRQYTLAKQILDAHTYELVERERKNTQLVDDLILKCAIDYKNSGKSVYIGTNDKELRIKCKNRDVGTIFLRKKQYLSIE